MNPSTRDTAGNPSTDSPAPLSGSRRDYPQRHPASTGAIEPVIPLAAQLQRNTPPPQFRIRSLTRREARMRQASCVDRAVSIDRVTTPS